MYGLFKNSYDYYEWHDLIAVSENREKLIALKICQLTYLLPQNAVLSRQQQVRRKLEQ